MLKLWKGCRRTMALAAIASVCLTGIARQADATMFGISDGGVVEAAGCMAASCGSTQTFDDTIGGFAAVSGTIMIDAASDTLDLSITLVDAIGLTAMGAPDNGISAIAFTDVVYSVAGLSLIEVIPGSKFIISGAVPGGPTATVTGNYSQDAALAQAFVENAVRITGSCTIVADDVTCGFGFGTAGLDLAVGAAPEDRFFRHTMNVTAVVPEPSTGLLLALGLLGLTLRRR